MALEFARPVPDFDFGPGFLRFQGHDGDLLVKCGITAEALLFKGPAFNATGKELAVLFLKHWNEIEQVIRRRYSNRNQRSAKLLLVTKSDFVGFLSHASGSLGAPISAHQRRTGSRH